MLLHFFVNNSVNYVCWLPIQILDIMYLEKQHPAFDRKFHEGNFVVHRMTVIFHSIDINQAHEHNNAVKAYGRTMGLTEDPSNTRRWMLYG